MLNRTSSSTPRQSAVYRPTLRDIPAEVLTPSGWIGGTLVLPERQSLVDHLSKSGSFLKLTAVRLPARAQLVPFFALQAAATVLVVPAIESRLEGEPGHATFTSVPVTFLLTGGVIDGKLAVPTTLRLSDHLRAQSGFVVVRDAQWTPHRNAGEPQPDARRTLPCVLVNASLVIGVEEVEPRPSAG
jgi:hypothetical protein